MRLESEHTDHTAPKPPAWLAGAHREANDGLYLRLMIINPWNGELSPVLDTAIDADPLLNAPGPSDLHIGTA